MNKAKFIQFMQNFFKLKLYWNHKEAGFEVGTFWIIMALAFLWRALS